MRGAAPSENGSAEEEVLDSAVFEQICDLFESEAKDLVLTYLKDTPTQLQTMTASLATSDAAPLGRAAHSIKSTSRSLGAMIVGKLPEELELMSRDGRLDEAAIVLTNLRHAYTAVELRLRQWVRQQERRSA
jgi:HPt (histidine-containing phosphotransfer) domain-containing protein